MNSKKKITEDETVNTQQKLRTFDLIREAVLPEFRALAYNRHGFSRMVV
jgi:hypothetical protein